MSLELLVIIILSLVILGFGLAFLYQLIGGAEQIKSELDAKTQAELERLLLDEGKKVALSLSTAALSRGETHVFGLGILNLDKESFGQEFTLAVSLSKAVDEEGSPLPLLDAPSLDTSSWLLYNPGPFTLKDNEHRSEPILVKIPPDAPKGIYIFNVQVENCPDGSCTVYDNIKKFTVVVK